MSEIKRGMSEKQLTRRDLLKGALLTSTGVLKPDFTSEILAAPSELAGSPDFELPVTTTERDVRVRSIDSTVLNLSEELRGYVNPPEISIDSIGFNPKYSDIEAQNRVDVAVANALIRAHHLSKNYLIDYDGTTDFTPLRNFIGSTYPEPDWIDYVNHLDNTEEDMTFKLVAIPIGAGISDAKWMTADVRRGINLNFVHEPCIIGNLKAGDQTITSSTIRVDDTGKVNLDIYSNMSIFNQAINNDAQQAYTNMYALSSLQALQMVCSSLGILYSYNSGDNLYENNVLPSYTFDKDYLSLFPEQGHLLLGKKTYSDFKEAVIRVNLQS